VRGQRLGAKRTCPLGLTLILRGAPGPHIVAPARVYRQMVLMVHYTAPHSSRVHKVREYRGGTLLLETRDYGRSGSVALTTPHFYTQKLVMPLPTSGGGSVGIARAGTKETELLFHVLIRHSEGPDCINTEDQSLGSSCRRNIAQAPNYIAKPIITVWCNRNISHHHYCRVHNISPTVHIPR
jgi:hypothetical protein